MVFFKYNHTFYSGRRETYLGMCKLVAVNVEDWQDDPLKFTQQLSNAGICVTFREHLIHKMQRAKMKMQKFELRSFQKTCHMQCKGA